MIPAWFSPVLFALVMTFFLTCVVSGLLTLVLAGIVPGLPGIWFRNWMLAWIFAFPTAALVSPLARRIVARVVRP